MKKIILLTGLAFFFLAKYEAQVTENLNKPFIEVTGSSETEITPDEIYITITLTERMENKEKISIEKQEGDLKQNIKELGIDLGNLTLNTADADFRKIKASKKDVFISKSYILKTNSADMVGKVYERLDKMNAMDAYISKYSHSKILDFQKENRTKAIKASKEKVDYLLAAIGQQAGQPIQIIELDNYVQSNQRGAQAMYSNVAQSYNYDRVSDNETSEIAFKKIKIRASFKVKYEILNK